MRESFLRDLDFHSIKSVTISPVRRIDGELSERPFNTRDITFINERDEIFHITLFSTNLDFIPLTLADKSTHAI